MSENVPKSLSEYSFTDIIDMSRDSFDEVMKSDKSNIGYLTNLKKLLSMHYQCIWLQIEGLTQLHNHKSVDDKIQEDCVQTIRNLFGVLFSIEYKACCLHDKIKELSEQATD